ncbi:hypothetical protein [Nisaea sp.]|uniref:hypothetical protein n=1 Tax=Nisaea sp. TaxID=2024842 RepID=UPI002B266F4A|nr:hypothetical protein [Nisaea sp.]
MQHLRLMVHGDGGALPETEGKGGVSMENDMKNEGNQKGFIFSISLKPWRNNVLFK